MQYLNTYWGTIKYLEIGGGGSASIGTLGALKRLVEQNPNALKGIKGISGCSAGATVALVLVLNNLNVTSSIIDIHSINWGAYESSGWRAVLYEQGRCNARVGQRMLEPLLKRRGCTIKLTMGELWARSNIWLRIRAVNLKNGQVTYFDHLSAPNMYVLDAIWATAAIPWAHQPLKSGGNVYVDGGLRKNYCRKAFSSPLQTHGFSVKYNYADFAGEAHMYMHQLKIKMCTTTAAKNIHIFLINLCFLICCAMAIFLAPSVEGGHSERQTTSLPTKRFAIQDIKLPLQVDVDSILLQGQDAYDTWALQTLRMEITAIMLWSNIFPG
jgi:hypothetical protein